ncbi:hypothetical protein [Candidatus Methylacidithermus pantelleriae]|nr:hypothetical protein [Candidatus Methylacidithermus pantelleriae]
MRSRLQQASITAALLLAIGQIHQPGAQKSFDSGRTVVRFGHFPNITHPQGVIAHALSRQGEGWFEQRLGPNAEVQWHTYNVTMRDPQPWKQFSPDRSTSRTWVPAPHLTPT